MIGGLVDSGKPTPNITNALLMEDGSLFLMEDDKYFKLENENKNV